MPPQRRKIGATRARQTVEQITSPREALREARQYAELWFQALHTWKVEYAHVPVPSISYSGFRDSWAGNRVDTLGEMLPDKPSTLNLPALQLAEGYVAREISDMTHGGTPDLADLASRLERIRAGTAPATLIREGGWISPRRDALRYAVAVLTLAVRLRVLEAEPHLLILQRELSNMRD